MRPLLETPPWRHCLNHWCGPCWCILFPLFHATGHAGEEGMVHRREAAT
ncbi:hypothetical protein [Larsenimonas rhizosphaerae]|uniref:Uncharacterized protein n=1 Tax=Larsenimonas rhizosphaerae TaxID=2944682 RepID=A0AA41ZIQ4_9GAMM|nr:hypothetical protein [Larsenimonas rhizosphaerae]MCX2525355.1 hypothetical protein [Larsenimonas rhizosphaerae]